MKLVEVLLQIIMINASTAELDQKQKGSEMANSKWENVTDEYGELTERFKVEGGHIYRTFSSARESEGFAMCFVPDIDLSRYQSHLRDAYKQGYRAGQEDASLGVIAENT